MSPDSGTITETARSLRAVPEAVATARAFTKTALADVAETDSDHVDDVVVVVSELATNAVKYASGARIISLVIEVWPRWTVVTVDDRDPDVHEPPPACNEDGPAGSGRGLSIVRAYAERFWWRRQLLSKTANAVILRSKVELTAEDKNVLDSLEDTDD